MRLPLLALRPTGGTNQSESGGSNDPLRPAPGAAAVMDEALGLPELEIVRNILEQIHAGDEEGAKEQACAAVDGWLFANRLHSSLRDEDAVWAALMRNVFPNAPTPVAHNGVEGWLPEDYVPSNNKELFYAMCNRYRHLRVTQEAFERLSAERDEAARENYEREGALQSFMQAHPGFVFYDFARKEEPAPEDADPQLKAEWKRVARAFRNARRRWLVLDDRVRREWDNVLDARSFVREWVPSPALLKPKREPLRPWFYLRNEPDTSDEDVP